MTEAVATPRLMIVADLAYAGGEARLLDALDALGPLATDERVAIQLRAKALDAAQLAHLAREACERVPAAATLILNGAPEIAAKLDFDGVHWPEQSLPEHLPGVPRWHSAAVHSLESLRRAEAAGAHAVVFGSVWAPGSKSGDAAGLEALREICAAAQVPVIAIGGVMPDRVAACLGAGAHGVAVVSGILGAPRPSEAARQYLDALDQAPAASETEVSR